jgi:5-methylcytosine-specific restriction endonuclease McrA
VSRLHKGGHRRNVALALVLARDGRRCRRCDRGIQRGLSGLHPMGPTLGHIIPASLGGSDELSNLAPEHRSCNLAAGASFDPPMAVVATPPVFLSRRRRSA